MRRRLSDIRDVQNDIRDMGTRGRGYSPNFGYCKRDAWWGITEIVPITNPETHRLGGKARAATMTPEQRSDHARKMRAAQPALNPEQLQALSKKMTAARRKKQSRLQEAA